MSDPAREIAILSASPAIAAVLRRVCDLTGMGFAAVARVTEHRWIACHILDEIDFGLEPGGELEIRTTICNEIRASGEAVFIDSVADSPMWKLHPTPILYGFQSYVSVPVYLPDGAFFGTLCAIDPAPHEVSSAAVKAEIETLALEVAACLAAERIA